MNKTHSILIIAVVSIVTAALRFLPFLIFNGKKKTPKVILYLGKALPFAVMGMLIVYCFKNVSPLTFPFGLPELIAAAITALLHIWKKNTLVSIIAGTLSYMLLVQFIFI